MIFSNTTPTAVVPNAGHMRPHHNEREHITFRGERDMNTRLITESEIVQRQFEVRQGAYRARHGFTIAGMRQLIGSTFIALGTRLHGQCENRRLQNPQTTSVPAHGV